MLVGNAQTCQCKNVIKMLRYKCFSQLWKPAKMSDIMSQAQKKRWQPKN